jgi:glycine C-acetyltransferase
MGGFVAGSADLIEYLKRKSRPFLFSSALNPGDAAGVLKSIDILERDDSLVKKLWRNSDYLKRGLKEAGFNTGNSKTPITPVMIGDEKKTLELSDRLFREKSVFASPIVYPTVPLGTARIRLMPSALHSEKDLDYAIAAFSSVGITMGIVR